MKEIIKHIYTIVWNQRRTNAWLCIELSIITVCLWYVVDFTGIFWWNGIQPMGMNVQHTYQVNLEEKTEGSVGYIEPQEKSTTAGEDILQIVERIRQQPSIESVSLSVKSQPYISLMQGGYNQLYYEDSPGLWARHFRVTPSFFDVFQVHSETGSIDQLKEALTRQSVIITPDVVEKVIGNEQAVGRSIQISQEGQPVQIGAISVPLRPTDYQKMFPSFFTLLTEQEIVNEMSAGDLMNLEICIRVKPDADKDYKETFITEMAPHLSVGNLFLVDIRSTYIYRERMIGYEKALLVVRALLLGFLLINIFLGISGTFSFRTRQRRNELGLRIAVGSSRRNLYYLLMLEGIILLSLAVVPALFINLNIGLTELVNVYWVDFSLLRYIGGMVATYVLMCLMIISGIWYPAYTTMKLEPAEALRYE
ncbi:MAG: ABC transporter permease [Tannerellaceae bacterium]|nr:ABC transporter permease [Tannerellaceae bacterium]